MTIEGTMRLVTGSLPKETRRAALDTATAHAAATGRSVLVNARDANGSWQLVINPAGVVRAAGAEDTGGAAPKRRRRRVGLLVGGGVLSVAVVAGLGATVVHFLPGEGPPQPTEDGDGPSHTLDARPAPPGFGEEARWRLTMRPDTQPDVAPDESAAAFIDPEGQLVVVGEDGEEKWSADLPLDPEGVEGRPRFVRQEDGYGIALVDAGNLWQWSPQGDRSDPVELPEDANVVFAGTAPLVLSGDEAFVPAQGELEQVELPGDSGAMVADGQRVLTAVAHGPWNWVTPDGTSTEVEPTPPEGAGELDEVLTAREEYVIVRWSAAEGDGVVLAVHDSGDGSVVAATGTTTGEIADARWVEGASVAAYGPVVVDLAEGDATTVSGFEPANATGDVVYGSTGGVPVAVDAEGEPREMEDGAARPWGLVDGRAVVVADGDLYALSPE
ncbi:hypothetical protein [Haloactinospora alba]|uniref:hypothetical protein n=1 Tax=Haloactinospora alba TaxID=405555 RepID=UPI001FE2EDC4|nr:hypothetical protein [Haloactinospora alba]